MVLKDMEISRMYLLIMGSRALRDERVKITILEAIEKYKPTAILTFGEPEGVCALAQEIAKQNGLPLKLHFLNFRYLAGAFEHRSKAGIKDCDRVLIIHDGKSKGTTNERKLVEKAGKPFDYKVLEKSEFTKSVGFEITTDWE